MLFARYSVFSLVCAWVGSLASSWVGLPMHACLGQERAEVVVSDDAQADGAGQLEFFEKHVRPLLVERCYACHAGLKSSGGLRLDSRASARRGGDSGAAIVPGKPDESLLLVAVSHRNDSLAMPPKGQGQPLNKAELAIIRQWIEMGAPDPRNSEPKVGGMTAAQAGAWWAFQPLSTDTLPSSNSPSVSQPSLSGSKANIQMNVNANANATANGANNNANSNTSIDANSNPIDLFLKAKMQEAGIEPLPEADPITLARRVAYDLTGLPPQHELTSEYLADPSLVNYRRMIDRTLDSPHYGEQWGRHWLDLVRYADTAGENTDRPLPQMWRYRNWVIDAFNNDLPYDEFVKLQIAGDLIRSQEEGERYAEGVIATGYLALARRFGHDIDKDVHLMHEDVIDNLGKCFLGLTIACARCHDHKFDAIEASDYYALYGIFASSRFSFSGCEAKGQPRDLVPLWSSRDAESAKQKWQAERQPFDERLRVLEAQVSAASSDLAQRIKSTSVTLLTRQVEEGGTIEFAANEQKQSRPLRVRRGDMLALRISPQGNHGADTTQVQWDLRARQTAAPPNEPGTSKDQDAGKDQISTQDKDSSKDQLWSTGDLIDGLTGSNPGNEQGAVTPRWAFIEWQAAPRPLMEAVAELNGRRELKAIRNGDTPSVLVNTSTEPVKVWTTLAPRSLFMHPGPNSDAVLVWISPIDGEITFSGRVSDAHPGGPNGVTVTVEHWKSTAEQAAIEPDAKSVTLLSRWMEMVSESNELIQISARRDEASGPEPQSPMAFAVIEGEPKNSRLHLRGDPERPGDEVERRWLAALGGERLPANVGSGRRELAEWIVAHPLSTRVTVNRIWQYHFGQGLVRTPNDFGSRGEQPTHPELLEWLSVEFQRSGRSLKSMHRLLMNSQAYRRASRGGEKLAESDPDNRLWARFTRRRMTAEELRDSLLTIGGNLDAVPGMAHPFPPQSQWTFTQHTPFHAVYDDEKRTIYQMVQRQRRHPFLALFDGADPNASTAARQLTTAPTQALYFLNDPFFHAQTTRLADRLLKLDSDSARMQQLTATLFERGPKADELAAFEMFLASYPGDAQSRWSALCRVLAASNEFVTVE